MDLLKQLIEIPSTSGHEQNIQGFIFNWLKSAGLNPRFVGGNIIVEITGQDQHKLMIFNAHVDTVFTGNLNLWQTNPFQAVEKGSRIYGLGASDEKAGVAALMLLAQKFAKTIPDCSIAICFVVKEEVDGSGTEEVMNKYFQPKLKNYSKVSGVLTEPTNLNKVFIGCKGNIFIKLTSKGQGGHGSSTSNQKNSLLIMAKALIKLEKLCQKWQSEFVDPELGIPSIAIGTSVNAGNISVPNKVPEECVASLDIRTTPRLHSQSLALIKKELSGMSVKAEYLYQPVPYGLTHQNDHLIKAVKKLKPTLKVSTAPWSSDQPFFTQLKIPSIVIGPGDESLMHSPNEFCDLEILKESILFYQKLIKEWTKNS